MKKSITFTNYFVLIVPLIFFLSPFSTTADEELQAVPGISKLVSSGGMTMLDTKVNTSIIPVTPVKTEEIMTEIKFLPIEKVKSGIVQTVDSKNNSLIIKVGNTVLPIENNATTSFYFGEGSEAKIDDVDTDMKIYVFGYIKSDNSLMSATKIVIANESRLHRK